jgi:sulfate permease, SulP family
VPDQTAKAAFLPALIQSFRQGYDALALRKDLVAGLTVAIVALPLSMAIAIASHAPPQAGLMAAIVGGFMISAFGGSRYQIGGPAGAFIVLVASVVDQHGMGGLLLATFMAGVIILLMGLFRLGSLVRHVPHPVIVGFTAGIGVIIFASQIHDLLGLTLPGAEPAPVFAKLVALALSLPTSNIWAALVSALTVALIVLIATRYPRTPGLLVAVLVSTLVVYLLHAPVETIAARFGEIPNSLPMPALPLFTIAKLWQLAPAAVSIALLGSIESLLSAVVADSMSGEKHNANMELVAQGLANMAVALFGGIVATGTIARTATNVRAHAHGPLSGIFHAAYLLLFLLLAAPLLGYIPMAALAGILAVVSFRMIDWHQFGQKLLVSRRNTLVLFLTLGLTVFEDLLVGIAVGTAVWWVLHWLSLRNKASAVTERP